MMRVVALFGFSEAMYAKVLFLVHEVDFFERPLARALGRSSGKICHSFNDGSITDQIERKGILDVELPAT